MLPLDAGHVHVSWTVSPEAAAHLALVTGKPELALGVRLFGVPRQDAGLEAAAEVMDVPVAGLTGSCEMPAPLPGPHQLTASLGAWDDAGRFSPITRSQQMAIEGREFFPPALPLPEVPRLSNEPEPTPEPVTDALPDPWPWSQELVDEAAALRAVGRLPAEVVSAAKSEASPKAPAKEPTLEAKSVPGAAPAPTVKTIALPEHLACVPGEQTAPPEPRPYTEARKLVAELTAPAPLSEWDADASIRAELQRQGWPLHALDEQLPALPAMTGQTFTNAQPQAPEVPSGPTVEPEPEAPLPQAGPSVPEAASSADLLGPGQQPGSVHGELLVQGTIAPGVELALFGEPVVPLPGGQIRLLRHFTTVAEARALVELARSQANLALLTLTPRQGHEVLLHLEATLRLSGKLPHGETWDWLGEEIKAMPDGSFSWQGALPSGALILSGLMVSAGPLQ